MKNSRAFSKKTDDLAAFTAVVWSHYKRAGRSFPWRLPTLKLKRDGTAIEPYHVLLSEVMLQQTQAGERTIAKFTAFIEAFPTLHVLAEASLRDVYRLWQGLGYNRRAKVLRDAASIMVQKHGGVVPDTNEELLLLPGIGPYTAAAIQAFAFNIPVVLIETNVRTAYIHHFFPNRDGVTDAELLPYIEATLDRKRTRQWYSALMDYGAHLKKIHGNLSRKSRHYTRQSAFKGSRRELRGKLLRTLLQRKAMTEARLAVLLESPVEELRAVVAVLIKEGFVIRRGSCLMLA